MTPLQAKGALALTRWTVEELAAISGISYSAIEQFMLSYRKAETSKVMPSLRTVFEKAGIEFIADHAVSYPRAWNKAYERGTADYRNAFLRRERLRKRISR